MMSVGDFIQAGNLAEAITAATADVKQQPLRPEPRVVLAELMCFAGNIDRADTLIEAATKLHKPKTDLKTGPAPGLVLLRQLLRGDVARQQFYDEGRPPETKSLPTADLTNAIQSLVEFRAGDLAAAAKLITALTESEERKVVVQLTSGEEHTSQSFRDLNDLTASVAELISASGSFFWVPWTDLRRLKFEPVKTLRDILWRPVECTFMDDTTERFFMPCLYAGTARSTVDAYRLGQGTDWAELGAGLTSGIGLRMFLTGELTPSILELADIQFE